MKNTLRPSFLCAFLFLNFIFAGAQNYPTELILDNGETDKHINFVILADGYTTAEMQDFQDQSVAIKDYLFETSPFKEYQNFFNVITIASSSNESGADHPGTATDVPEPVIPVVDVDNLFGSSFDVGNIHRLLYPAGTSSVFAVTAENFPAYDQIVLAINSPEYGGGGGAIATTSANVSSTAVAVHELGHSFANLTDEYCLNTNPAEGFNITNETNPNLVKWKNWIGDEGIGIYPRCSGTETAYIPKTDCKMRQLGRPFCAVCKERIVNRIYELVSPIKTESPAAGNYTFTGATAQFSLDLILPNPNTLSVQWLLNGNPVGTNTSVEINVNQLSGNGDELEAIVTDATPLVRTYLPADGIKFNRTWQLEGNVTTNCPSSLSGYSTLGEFENSKYFLSDATATWNTAATNAAAQGGYLASITSAAENDFLLGQINEIVFIGLNDAQVEGTFAWDSGEAFSFSKISDVNTAQDDYGKMNFWNGNWGFDGATVARKYIVEIPCNSTGVGISITNCPESITRTAPASSGYQIFVAWDAPTATTDCAQGGLTIIQILGPTSGSNLGPIGNGYTVVYEISDACGNVENCVFFININPEPTEYICPNDITLSATSAAGAVVNYDAPTLISYCTPTVNPYTILDGLPSGSTFPIGTTEVRLQNFLTGAPGPCQTFEVCVFNVTILPEGGGECPDDLSGFTTLGEFGNSKYYLSNDSARPTDAQITAENNGGYLAVINSAAENEFVRQGVEGLTYIGLNDYDAEGNLEWVNGEPLNYNNINPCGFCLENSADQDFVVMASWDGAWSFSNFYNQRKYVMEVPCDGGGALPDLTVSNLTNLPNSVGTNEVVEFNFDLNNVGNETAVADYRIGAYLSTDNLLSADDILAGEVPTGNTVVGTIADVPASIFVPNNLASGTYYLILKADDNNTITESNENNNTVSRSLEIDGGTTNCPTSLSGFISLGEFGGSAYFLSENIARPADAQTTATSLGGYLAVLQSSAENDFIANQLSELAYLGLNDAATENSLSWVNGEPVNYTNFNICGFCNENSESMDYVMMHSWDGAWSWSNTYNQRKYVVEIPCDSQNSPALNNLLISTNFEKGKPSIEKLIPNPALNFIDLTIKSSEAVATDIHIFDARGILVKMEKQLLQRGTHNVRMDISDLVGGFYFVKILGGQANYSTKRFIKVRD